jgi:hypothetical protein
VFPE